VHESIDERDDATGVGEDFGPFAEGLVGDNDHGAALIAASDDLEEQVGVAGVIREIPDLVHLRYA
jgi:hypothetical protein